MKVDKPGNKQWWAGLPLRCVQCGCEFHLEDHDTDRMMIRWAGPLTTRCVNCPTCGEAVPVRRPAVEPNTEPKVRH